MPDHDKLIDALCAQAVPVRRVSPAWMRAGLFVPLMLALGVTATLILHRAVTQWAPPDAAVGMVNAALSVLLGIAAFIRTLMMSVAGGSVRWRGWMSLFFGVWLAVALSGLGEPAGLSEAYAEGRNCFTFLLTAGLPMVAVVIVALRRTRSLTPVPSLITAGCSIAFLSFGLLAFCHPAATTIWDTLGHLAAALVLGALTTLLGLKAISV
jgi:hypothetical protein